MVRVQPRELREDSGAIRRVDVQGQLERRGKDGGDDDVGGVDGGRDDSVREEVVGRALERAGRVQRFVGRVCCHHGRLLSGVTVGEHYLRIRVCLGSDWIEQARSSLAFRRPSGSRPAPWRVWSVGSILRRALRGEELRPANLRWRPWKALRSVHGRRRQAPGRPDHRDPGNRRVGDRDDGSFVLRPAQTPPSANHPRGRDCGHGRHPPRWSGLHSPGRLRAHDALEHHQRREEAQQPNANLNHESVLDSFAYHCNTLSKMETVRLDNFEFRTSERFI